MWYAVSAHLTPPVAIGALVAAGMAVPGSMPCAEAESSGRDVLHSLVHHLFPVIILRQRALFQD
jgi:TRAP-type uncharacterized transport system fused permease subunit